MKANEVATHGVRVGEPSSGSPGTSARANAPGIQAAVLWSVRGVGLFAAAAWGWYVAASFRTSDWGYDQPLREASVSLLVFCLYGLPFAVLPVIGVPWRRAVVILAVLTCTVTLTTEAFARTQEFLLIRRLGRNPTEDYHEPRWSPFGHHSVGFARGKWWGCD